MTTTVLSFLAGLAFLLLGMIKLSEKMGQVLGVKIRQFIKYLAKKPIHGIGLGALSTGIFQSSAAIIVLTIGMVGAGLITFEHSLPLILGAGIGTTITAQLVAFRVTTIAPLIILIGTLIWLLGRDKLKDWGKVIFYFGLLFFGLGLISQVVGLIKNNAVFMNLLSNLNNPWLGVLFGIIITIILQSSSATTSLLVIFGQQGLINIQVAIPIILGANIGTTFTPFLISLRGGINTKRAGLSNIIFKLIGVLIVLPLIPYLLTILKSLTTSPSQQIAHGHLLFNLFIIAIFFFLLKPFAKLIKRIVPGQEEMLPLWPEYINKKYLVNPKLALSAIRKELTRGNRVVKKMFVLSEKIIIRFDKTKMENVFYLESIIDNLQEEIIRFINKVPKNKLTETEATTLIYYSAITDNIERAADRIDNLARLARHKHRQQVHFSSQGKKEIAEINQLLTATLNDITNLLKNDNPQTIKNILSRQNKIKNTIEISKENHLKRFYASADLVADGPMFNNLLINFQQISKHCCYIAHYIDKLSFRK